MVLDESGFAHEVGSVFIAVPVELESGKSTVRWALENLREDGTRFVIVHVHPNPAQMVATEATVEPHRVSDHKNLRTESAEAKLHEYIIMCQEQKVCCDKLIIMEGDVAKGLLDLVNLRGITKLVMGAAADERYSEEMESLDSKKAIRLMTQAAPFCKIWFTCKGRLICTREAKTTVPAIPSSSDGISINDAAAFASVQEIQHRGGEHYYDQNFLSPHEENTAIDATGYDRVYVHQTTPEDKLLSAIEKITGGENLNEVKLQIKKMVVTLINDHKLEMMKRKDDNRKLGQRLDTAKNEAEAARKVKETIWNSCQRELEDLKKENENMASLIKDLEVKLETNKCLPMTQQQRDAAAIEAETLNTEFSYSELEEATQGFSDSHKIGEGIYKGFLRNTIVAIKLMDGQSELFNQQVADLGRVRHPNIVTLIGACREAFSLVYEFLPNGSLEDRLTPANDTPPLTWQVRTSIILELWSVLTFLHSRKPHPVVHGDLKAANIFLDANFVSKLGDLGICRLLGTSSELTKLSDMAFFGVIILRLLTGLRTEGITEAVNKAVEEDKLDTVLDISGGYWPPILAKLLVQTGLRCAEMSQQSQRPDPDLQGGMWKEVDTVMKVVAHTAGGQPVSEDDADAPWYYFCPILYQVMDDPHVAADGFTYEAEAMREWLRTGSCRSPMTGEPLAHVQLTPNRIIKTLTAEFKGKKERQNAVRGNQENPSNIDPGAQSQPPKGVPQAPTTSFPSSTGATSRPRRTPNNYAARSHMLTPPPAPSSLPDQTTGVRQRRNRGPQRW